MLKYLLHVPTGETYPVHFPDVPRWYNAKPDVINAVEIAQTAEDNTHIQIPWGDCVIYFTKKFDAFLFKCATPEQQYLNGLNVQITVLSEEFELIDGINTQNWGVI